MLLAGRGLDRGDDLAGDAQFGEGAKGGVRVGLESRIALKRPIMPS